MEDYLIKATAEGVRIYALVTTGLVQEANERHQCSHLSIAALGRAMNGALLFAATMKDNERVTLRFSGDGPLGNVVADAEGTHVRGYVENPNAFLPLKNGKLDVGAGIGKGTLTVTRFLANAEPFNGFCDLKDGEIASDLTNYLYTSEQTPASVALGVMVDKEGKVIAAGGWFIQAMPDCEEEVLIKLENNVMSMPYVTELLNSGFTPEKIVMKISEGLALSIKEKLPVEFKCRCSKEKVIDMLATLSSEELSEMEQDEVTEVHCQFCNEIYKLTSKEIKTIKNKI
ncbi:MAG: Hsp33 family molecular chaperone HslO [Acidaminococcaceae bacterium]